MKKKKPQNENRIVYSSKTDDVNENPFSVLKSLIQESPLESDSQNHPKNETTQTASPNSNPTELQILSGKKVIISKSRAGRSGKTVTLLECRDTSTEDLNYILSILKNRMGCGGYIEENARHQTQIILQGDLRERLKIFLISLGILDIKSGN